jgi:hypothetical protein
VSEEALLLFNWHSCSDNVDPTMSFPANDAADNMVRNAARVAAVPVSASANMPVEEFPDQITLERTENMRTRCVSVMFKGSPATFQNKPASTKWGMENAAKTAELFGISGLADPSNPKRQVDLRQVRFHGVRAIKTYSTMPFPVTVSITGVKGNSYVADGSRTALHVLPGVNTQPETLLRKSAMLQSAFADNYPMYNANNLSTLGITKLPSGRLLVAQTHPAIGMIRMNPDIMNMNESLDDTPLVEDCHTVTAETINKVLQVLESEVVGRMPDVDCSRFSASMARMDGQAFGSTSGLADSSAATKDGMVLVQLEMDFELPRPDL